MVAMQIFRRIGAVVFIGVILASTFGIGAYVGYHQRPAIDAVTGLAHKSTGQPADVDFSQFWQAWQVLNKKYAGDAKFDNQAAVYGAIEGMVKSLGDPYTVFFPPKEKALFDSEVKGKFGGIGAEIGMRKDIITIIAPLKGSPAQRAGLKTGDKVFKIDEKTTTDLTVEEAVNLIRGPQGTLVALTILRNGENETRVIKITREIIHVPALDTERKQDGIFVISLHSFLEDSSYEFRKAVEEAIRAHASRIVLDLRDDPGGYLEAAVDIASWFLKSGEMVVREDYGNNKEDVYRSKGYGALEHIPVVVLINEGSASASEILAGALRDGRHVPLVGKKSFGKGSVQELVDLTDKTSLKVTIARWLTPSGKSLSKDGLDPDAVVEVKKEDVEAGRDPQMDKAIEILMALHP